MPKLRRILEIAIPIALLATIVLAYFPVLNFYQSESARRAASLVVGNDQNPDRVAVAVRVLSIDPQKGDMALRLELVPQGAWADEGGFLAARDMILYVNNSAGSQERTFQKGKPLSPMDVTLSLYDGLPTDYPFDSYLADLQLFMVTSGKEADQPQEIIPLVTSLYANLHGYQFETTVEPEGADLGTFVTFKVARAFTTVFFAVFIMIAMWALSLCVLSWALSVLIRKRRIEATLFGWVGAMLFAFPALRNAVPGAPPIGALTDFLAFFWAEAIVMISLAILVYCYLSRPLSK